MSAAPRAVILGLLVPLATAACSGGHRRDGNRLIVLDHSIGGVALNEKRSAVERVLGRGQIVRTEDQKPPEPPAHTEQVRYPAAGLEIWYVSHTRSDRANGYVFVERTTSPRYRTPQGIGVGSTAAELRRIRGVKCSLETCQHGFHTAGKPGTGFRLDPPGGRIVYIDLAVDAS